jgi:hypothetical protein
VKRDTKRARTDATDKICKSCRKKDHGSARSRDCDNYKSTKNNYIKEKLGRDYETFTITVPFDKYMKPEYRDLLKDKIISTFKHIRKIVYWAQLLVDFWNKFKRRGFIIYEHSGGSISASLRSAYEEVATYYCKAVIENLPSRLLRYLR